MTLLTNGPGGGGTALTAGILSAVLNLTPLDPPSLSTETVRWARIVNDALPATVPDGSGDTLTVRDAPLGTLTVSDAT